MNNQRLLAGFFRYHREKLNYSQRGLVDENELSSLNAFEHGKNYFSEEKLSILFKMIGFDYFIVNSSETYFDQYSQIIELILNGEIEKAVDMFEEVKSFNIFQTLGCMHFLLLSYVFSVIRRKNIEENSRIVLNCKELLTKDELAILQICEALEMFYQNDKYNSLNYLIKIPEITFNSAIRAWCNYYLGIVYGTIGDYYNAQKYTEYSLEYYSHMLSFRRMIQLNHNLGSICLKINSMQNAERYYINAFEGSLKLKEAYKITTKSFHCLCWLYFKTNQYNKITQLTDQYLNEIEFNENTLFILAWSSYKTGHVNECLNYCSEAKEKYKDRKYPQIVFTYIENAAKGIKSNQDKLLNRAITMEDYEHNKEIDELFTMELIDIYEGRNTFESVKKANKLYRKLLNRK